MATLQKRSDSYRILFLYHGKRHTFTLGNVSDGEAESKAQQVDYLLMRIKQGLLRLPPGIDIKTFLEFDGNPPQEQNVTEVITLGRLRDKYQDTHVGVLEDTSLDGIRLHFKHLVRTLGDAFPVATLTVEHLQQHADRRKTMKGIGGKLSSATIRKELITLRTAWNWGLHQGWYSGTFPRLRLVKMQKPDEKPPFQTRAEIERALALGGKSKKEIAALWDCLFLQLSEIDELLAHVQRNALQPWVYPMFCFAAHTGARRSEMLRGQITDVDFVGKTVLIHEKKRSHDKRTTRRVPLTAFLESVLKAWLSAHPGGLFLFAQAKTVIRSKTKRAAATPITRDEAHDHFKRTLADSTWKVLRGWHLLRHSFASNCAANGCDQRLIDAWLGHTTDIRRRYLHLIPSNERQAINVVFGTAKAKALPSGNATAPREG